MNPTGLSIVQYFIALLLTGYLLVATSDAAQDAAPDDEASIVAVTLDSGETLVAAVDARTDRQRLWLRFDGPTAVLFRSLAFDRVLSVEHNGQVYSNDELRDFALQIRTDQQSMPAGRGSERASGRSDESRAHGIEDAKAASNELVLLPQVRSIAVDAYVANWNATTEVDGLVLSISALDGYGHLVPVSGTLDVQLFADRRSRLKPQPTRIRRQFSRQGRWTRVLLAERGGEAVFLLPFQAIHPEFDFAIAGSGVVHVRCSIPGHGVFEASLADVRIRPISPIRDQLLDSQGSRFLRDERSNRAR